MQATMEKPEGKQIVYRVKEGAPTVYQFQRDYKFISAIVGPFGSGKSAGCLFKIIHLANKQEPGADGVRRVRWAVVRNTYTQLKDTTIKTVLDWFPPSLFGKYNKTEHNYTITGLRAADGGEMEIELLFRALDRPDQLGNLLSLEITGAWLNEFREIPKEIYEAIQGRAGRYPAIKDGGCTWYGVIMDSNPYDEESFYCEILEDDPADNVSFYRQPSGLSDKAENIKNLIPGYYTNLAKGKDVEYIKVYIKGVNGYIQEGAPITPEYDHEIHRSPRVLIPYPGVRGIRFWDAGHNPTCVVGQIHPVTGRLIIYDTWVGEHMGMIQLVRSFVKPAMNDKYKKVTEWFDTGDPACKTADQSNTDLSPARVIEDELQTVFVPGVSDWDTRKQAIKYVMTNQPMLQLSKNESRLHQAFRGGWHFKKLSDGKIVKDLAVKNIHSHPADAISQGLPRILVVRTIPPKKKKKKKHWLLQ